MLNNIPVNTTIQWKKTTVIIPDTKDDGKVGLSPTFHRELNTATLWNSFQTLNLLLFVI